MLPNWPVILDSLTTLPRLNSLRLFMYDLPKTVDKESCQMIAKVTSLISDFGFYFRHKFNLADGDEIEAAFKDHEIFIKQLFHCILLLSFDKQPYYSIEDDKCGLTIWF
jgi:hypothetical protein